jgi:hypothetical protein
MNHLLVLLLLVFSRPGGDALQDGDIIFQHSESPLSKAITLATHSPYSHCGIIFKKDGALYVYEAIEPVRVTPLGAWIARGDGGHYVVKRLKNAATVLTPAVVEKMKAVGMGFMGKHYDIYFGWSDDRIYCSELVWKIYHTATGLSVGQLAHLRDMDLSSVPVKKELQARYGDHIPMDEPVVSPGAIFDSPLLETVQAK